MQFPQQTCLQRQLPGVRALFQRRQLNAERIDTLAPLIEHFEIRLPFIGGFSNGKSSLINALLDEPQEMELAELRRGNLLEVLTLGEQRSEPEPDIRQALQALRQKTRKPQHKALLPRRNLPLAAAALAVLCS